MDRALNNSITEIWCYPQAKYIYIYMCVCVCVCVCVFKHDLALNNPQGLECHKTQPNHVHASILNLNTHFIFVLFTILFVFVYVKFDRILHIKRK